MQKTKFVAIAGGTGAGKSTLCFALWDKFPEQINIVHLDDYFRKREEFPILHGMPNADHPSVIRFDDLLRDLECLARGEAIKVMTKSQRLNPRYKEIGKIEVEIEPKAVMLVEGYLSLYDERIRSLFSDSIYLDLPHETRYARRVHFKIPDYAEKVLLPMHTEFVEPTKQYAKHVIEVEGLTPEQVLVSAAKILQPLLHSA